jgi:hypothetical protein
MNKRIQELKIQACKWASKNVSSAEYENAADQKFAELIVQECANLREDIELVGLPSEDYEQGFWDGLQMYQNQIKRHFGWIELLPLEHIICSGIGFLC